VTNFNYRLFTREPWMELGKCRGLPSELFLIEPGDDGREGKAVCSVCPVQKKCLEYALEVVPSGIWGNTTERERTLIKRGRRSNG
jgi:WhiB family transcriptional regulator, redox-sensing transcriptional regulator